MGGPFEEGHDNPEMPQANVTGPLGPLVGGALGKYAGAQIRKVDAPSYVERLLQRKMEMEAELAKVNEAIKALESNPEIEKVIHAITRVTGLY